MGVCSADRALDNSVGGVATLLLVVVVVDMARHAFAINMYAASPHEN